MRTANYPTPQELQLRINAVDTAVELLERKMRNIEKTLAMLERLVNGIGAQP